ncbi:MAG: hypothetical protein GY772_21315 [bacterium]|nr:hypothetical protein [bacterium]
MSAEPATQATESKGCKRAHAESAAAAAEVVRVFWSNERQQVLVQLKRGEHVEASERRESPDGLIEGFFEGLGWRSTTVKAASLQGPSVLVDWAEKRQGPRKKAPAASGGATLAETARPPRKQPRASGGGAKAKGTAGASGEEERETSGGKYIRGHWFFEHWTRRGLVQCRAIEGGRGASRAFAYKKFGGAEAAERAAIEFCKSMDSELQATSSRQRGELP